MPVVSVNLDDEAHRIYKIWRNHGRSASKKVSMAIRGMWEQEREVPALRIGDRRTSITGETLEWMGDGWKVIE